MGEALLWSCVCLQTILLICLDVGVGEEYCLAESFTAECPDGEVIVMEEARFGRMTVARCVTQDYGYVGCYSDVIGQLDAACSGRGRCELSVSDPGLVRTEPCPLDLSSYLEACYRCVTVLPTACPDGGPLRTAASVSSPVGYILSIQPPEGDTPCVYEISLPRGLRLNVSIIDFSAASGNDSGTLPRKFCRQFATIDEPLVGSSITVCGGRRREKPVYYSRTNLVTIRPVAAPADRFMIKYQVVGCSSLDPPPGMYLQEDGDYLSVICNQTGHTFRLRCVNNEWEGELGNCTTTDIYGKAPVGHLEGLLSMPSLGTSLMIVSGVALVIVVYAAVAIVCALFIRSRRRKGWRRCSADDTAHARTVERRCCHGDLGLAVQGLESEISVGDGEGRNLEEQGRISETGSGVITSSAEQGHIVTDEGRRGPMLSQYLAGQSAYREHKWTVLSDMCFDTACEEGSVSLDRPQRNIGCGNAVSGLTCPVVDARSSPARPQRLCCRGQGGRQPCTGSPSVRCLCRGAGVHFTRLDESPEPPLEDAVGRI